MSDAFSRVTIATQDFDAVLFDLDGVLTPTAEVHATAWKTVFDAFLRRRAASAGVPFEPFDAVVDYARYVDGKPRYDAVVAFLNSRGITLAPGSAQDPATAETMHGLGRLKDDHFIEHLKEHGVRSYESSVVLLHSLRALKVATAVVSSSKNCEAVLRAAGIADLFDARVDGNDVAALQLRGKPAPDAFLEGAKRLAVSPARAVVVEDAIAGVAAGHAGGFGMVIGVDRRGDPRALRDAGADAVVSDLDQVGVASESPSSWALLYDGFDPAREGMREALCALGNGYFTIRGAAVWASADGVHYPGVYLAGGYNRLRTDIGGRVVENEDLVNFPNWLALSVRTPSGTWLEEKAVRIISHHQELDLRRGMLLKTLCFEDDAGRRSTVTERRLVSMADSHIGAFELTLVADNWSGAVTVRSAIDGRVVNSGARLYRPFNNRHLEPLKEEVVGKDGVCLLVRTSQGMLHVAEAARTRLFLGDQPIDPARALIREPGYVGQEMTVELAKGDRLTIEKVAAIHTSRDHAISECTLAARTRMAGAQRFAALMEAHTSVWEHVWNRFDIQLKLKCADYLNGALLLRLNMLHLLQAVSVNSIGLDIGVPARGWTGEAYQGHIFWDELFILPTLNFRIPEITRSVLLYRFRRLSEARAAARAAGLRGAMFPWQSGSDGREETAKLNLNPRSQRWVPDNSFRQRHVGSAIAWNVWQYFQVTHNVEFMTVYGAELIIEIARFWASLAHFNAEKGRYEITGVMGPDEYHEGYPDAAPTGLKNDAYTNIMAVWVLRRAQDVLQLLSGIRRLELNDFLQLSDEEIVRWDDVSRRMFVPFDDGIILQFEGYEKLQELDWDSYRTRYGNIQRLDLILEAEGDSTNRYKVSKQPDVLMLFYLFSAAELRELLSGLGYAFATETIPRIVTYYDSRSSHGSTLSRVVHAWVLARSNRARSLGYFAEALQSDVADIQQGTTAEGVHLGAMAGTIDLVQRAVMGLETTGDVLRFSPQLPEEMERVEMRIRYRGQQLDLRLTTDALTVSGRDYHVAPIMIGVRDEVYQFECGTTREFRI